MDFRQLEAFVSTVNCRSFSAAAEALYLSQSTISCYIHSLEKELHTQLIHRTTKKFQVTKEGQQLYSYATALLQLQRRAISELSDASRNKVHIGASSVPGQRILPELLEEYHKTAPEARFHVTCSGSLDIIQQVEDGSLDVGLVGMKTESPCIFEPLTNDELVIATPNTEHFRTHYSPAPDLRALLREPMVIRTEQSGTKLEAEKLLRRLGLKRGDLNIAVSVNDAQALLCCVIQGLGISIVSCRMIQELEQQGKLLVFRLGQKVWKRTFYFVSQNSQFIPQSAQSFLQFLRSRSLG